jgi:hypothetical protein
LVLIDLPGTEERLGLVKRIADKMAQAREYDITISTMTNRRDGLRDCGRVAGGACDQRRPIVLRRWLKL